MARKGTSRADARGSVECGASAKKYGARGWAVWASLSGVVIKLQSFVERQFHCIRGSPDC